MGIDEARALLQLAIENLANCIDGPDAPYAAITDRETRKKPALPVLGTAGYTFTDPAFGSRIVRVTDGTTRPGRSYAVASNTHLAAWSANSSHFYVLGPEGPIVYAYDAAAFTATPIGPVPSQCEPTWSRMDPDALYTVGGPVTRTLRKYSLDGKSFVDLLDVDTLDFPGLLEPRTYIGGILAAGDPEAVAIWYGGQGQGGHYLVTVLHADDRLQDFNTATRLGVHLHSMGLDMSGRYVALYPNNAQPAQAIIWDLQTDQTVPLTVAASGHDALGFGDLVNQDGSGGVYDAAQWQYRSLTALDTPRRLIDPVLSPPEVYLSDHQSWNNRTPDGREPFISATYRYGAGIGRPWRAYVDEILGVSQDGTVYRFAHHRSDLSSGNFRSQPLIHVSPDGTAAIFQSTWENSLGLDTNEGGFRTDCFLLALR
jgi:hypothetical protein